MWLYGHRRTHMESMYMWPGMGTDNETMNLIYDYTDILDGKSFWYSLCAILLI